jgi:Zn-finger nucleic acid-binding protein
MKCPIDNAELVMTDRQGIEIDYCPQCRGVWLDRGELDKILERAASPGPVPMQQQFHEAPRDPAPRYEEPRDGDRRYDEQSYDARYGGKPRRRRESFLDDLFDFG